MDSDFGKRSEKIADFNDFHLISLAAFASVEIDNHICGRSDRNTTATHGLSTFLERVSRDEGFARYHIDIAGRAISGGENYEQFWNGKKVGDCAVQVNLAAKQLRDYRTLPLEQQEDVRDFCSALSLLVGSAHFSYRSRRLAC